MVSFRVTKPCFLVVLADSRKQMKWLKEDGFQEVVGHAIAMRLFRGSMQEVYFTIHGKYFNENELVELRGNYSKVITVMYSVFVVEAPAGPLPSLVVGGVLSQIQFHKTYNRSVPNRAWLDGGEGLAMFYTGDDSMRLGIPKGQGLPSGRERTKSKQVNPRTPRQSIISPQNLKKADLHYSEEIRISMTRVQHSGSFELVDWESRAAYQLAYRMRLMPGLFKYTQEVVVVPQFCVVNLMEEEIMLRQSGTKTETVYYPYQPTGWHKTDYDYDCNVQIGCKSSLFSLGMIDLNEVGSSTLLVQRRDDSSDGDKAIVLHVEVKVARPEERCGVVVVVWRSTTDNYSTMKIRNETDLHITVMQDIRQKYMMLFEKNKNYKNLFQICVAPHSTVPFGWADPELEGVVNVAIGTSIEHEDNNNARSQPVASLNMLRTGFETRLADGTMKRDRSSFNEVVFSVHAINGTRVLQCTRPTKTHVTTPSRRLSSPSDYNSSKVTVLSSSSATSGPGQRGGPPGASNPPLSPSVTASSVNFSLASFGVSLVVEKPVRRELMSLYVDGLFVQYGSNSVLRQSFVELSVANAQVDNYSESVIHPVLLYDLRDNQPEGGGNGGGNPDIEDMPLLKLTIITESPLPSKDGTGTMSIVKYIGARLMPMAFQVDSATIQLLYTDLLNDLKYVTREQSVASSAPGKYMNDRNLFLIGAESDAMVDVYESKTLVQLSKMYIEHMELHPMKFRVTFVQTPFPRRGSMNVTLHSTFMNIVTSLAGIEKVELRLKSFSVKDALESVQSLRSAVVQKTWQDIKGQLGSVLGSMAAIGSPLGFAKKIGGGVTDLFYEPYQGAMHSPVEFVSGVGKGTASLASNVVGGVFSSVGSIAGTASKGIGYLSGDGDYVRRRALKKQRLRAQGGGFFDGLLDGGDSIVSGVSSGLSGLVTRPVEEAQKSGAKGFLKGVGLGILGAVVKPIMGVTDAVTGVATGISNQVTNETVAVQVRPVRAMLRSEYDSRVLVIGPMNVKAADAQQMILQRAKNLKYEDSFLDFVVLDRSKEECVILTETYVYWRTSNEKLWGRVWANISHVMYYGTTVGIYLYTSSSKPGARKVVEIPCCSRDLAMVLYNTLARNAFRMGNPSNVASFVSVQQQARTFSDEDFRRVKQADPSRTFTLDNMLDGYLFGTNNDPRANTNLPNLSEDKLKLWLTREMQKPVTSWASLDKVVWRFVCQWDSAHRGIQASRVCILTVVNRSDSPVQISRLSLDYGKEVGLYGSLATGYEAESRCVLPGGAVIVFACAHHPSPIEVGHLKAVIDCPSFTATVASTQRESSCESKGAFLVGFLEKSVSEWYAKYCLVLS